QSQRDRRSPHHRPRRYRDVLRQALGHRERRAPTAADRAARHRRRLVSKRRAEGRHAAADPRRRSAHGRRRLCRDPYRPARPDPRQRLVFGEYHGRRSARLETFYEACKRGGINAEISDDIRRSIWEKYVALVAMSGATTAMRQTIGPIRANPLTREFLLDL